MQNTQVSSKTATLAFASWKINQKKAVEKDNFSLARLLINLSIAFLIVISSAQILSSIYESFEQKSSKLPAFLQINSAQAASTAEYAGQIISNEEYLDLNAGEEYTYNIEIKNTGLSPWSKDEVFLETGPFLKNVSKVRHSSWIKYYRVAGLDQDIMPGEIAQISFKILAPQDINGTIQEYFQLVRDKVVVDDTLFGFFAELRSQDIAEDQEQVNRNTEEVLTQPVVVPEPVVAVAQDNEQNSGQEEDTDFCLTLSYEERMDYEECNTAVEENDQTSGITEKITLNTEPIIRVGLFNTILAQRVTVDDYFDVYAGDNLLLSSLSPGYRLAVSFDFDTKKYTVSTPSISKTTVDYIRIVPRNDGIVTLIDFENRPRWNECLNYNEYRGNMEFRYSVYTGKLWVINELPISDYLKGLAETSNYSPVDYQKVIVTAARTYVMYHYNRGLEYGLQGASTKHEAENFHVDATYDQVYKGYGSEKQLSRLVQAVDETKGTVVTYDGSVVVTPYFSRSDGRTRAWQEVWYGEAKPWLQSVVVPEDEGQTLWGHGVGMSARGALIMVRDELKGWAETLKYFYQGIELLKIYK